MYFSLSHPVGYFPLPSLSFYINKKCPPIIIMEFKSTFAWFVARSTMIEYGVAIHEPTFLLFGNFFHYMITLSSII